MLYEVRPQGPNRQYTYIRQVKIAGDGPLAAIQRLKNPAGECPFSWHAPGREIVKKITGEDDGHELVVDLKPYQSGNVSLYRVMNIWGHSYEAWTPLAVHLEALFVDMENHDPTEFKKRFVVGKAKRDEIGEFLYVQGGVREGNWNWGMVGRVNGALLWPDAFAYLTKSLAGVLAAR
jgi:hypothetical protein